MFSGMKCRTTKKKEMARDNTDSHQDSETHFSKPLNISTEDISKLSILPMRILRPSEVK